MATTRLTNERWGFSSNCFVCEPTNDEGLQLQFFHDDERDVVTTEFTLDDAFSGAPSYVHGGISLAVLDEIQSWATIAVARKFAVTTRTRVEFRKPVKIGETYRAEAEVTSVSDEVIETIGRILDADDKVRVEGVSTFHVLSAAEAEDAIGEVTGNDTHYLRDE